MTAIILRQFSGVAPATPPRYLANSQAQIAKNMRVFNAAGPLEGRRGVADVAGLAKSGTIQTIYRFGQDYAGDDNYWFHWPADVDVVRGFINGDVTERTFWTGDGIPKATDNALALAGTTEEYPASSYMLGLPVPDVAPMATNDSGGPAADETIETRVYTYTWVNSWGEESAPFAESPMPSAAIVDVTTGKTVTVSTPAPPTGPHDIVAKRIYRSVTGSSGATYLYVAEIDAATLDYTDDVLPDDLGNECPSLTWLPPKEDLAGLVGMAGGMLAGFSGHDVYFSEPFRPFAWPVQYMQSVGYPVVGLGTMDTTLAVLTEGTPYFIQGGSPDVMTVVESDIQQACVSKRSIVSMGGAVIYASPDGLVQLSPGGSGLITQGLFERRQWQALNPSSIHAYQHDGKYHGFYDTGTEQGGFVLDPATKTFAFHDTYADGGYADLRNDGLYLSIGGRVKRWDDGSAIEYTWRSKRFTLPEPVAFTTVRAEADDYPIEVDVYRDGSLIHAYTLTDGLPKRLPAGHGRTWELEVRGTGRLYSLGIAESPVELTSG